MKYEFGRAAASAVLALGIAGASMIGLAGPASAASRASAPAAGAHPLWYRSCQWWGGPMCATILDSAALLYAPDGHVVHQYPAGTVVQITCWFDGGWDGYYDHVSWDSVWGAEDGHVDDFNVDLGGHTPPNVRIPECSS